MGKVSPKLRFKQFIGEWEYTPLKSLLEFKNGINASKEQYGSGIKFINVLDILNNNYITHDKIMGSVNVDEKTIINHRVNYGDILFQRSSETREEVGTANVYLDTKPAVFGGFVIRGKKVGEYNPPFLNFLLKTPLARVEIMNKSGGSTRYNLTQSTLAEVNIILPKRDEQMKIAEFFSTLDSRINIQSNKVDILQELKKGYTQKIFSQEIRFKREDGSEYPEWNKENLEDVIERFATGLNPRKNFKLGTGENRYVTIKNIKNGKINYGTCDTVDNIALELINKRSDLRVNDILFTSIGDIGNCYVIRQKPTTWNINESVFSLRPNTNKVEPMFAYYTIINDDTQNYFKLNITGSTFKSIKMRELRLTPFYTPCIEEQQQIADFLATLDSKIDIETQILSTLQILKKGLLQQMFV